MALGGGTFTSQNKELPGAYINFVSAAAGGAGGAGQGAYLVDGAANCTADVGGRFAHGSRAAGYEPAEGSPQAQTNGACGSRCALSGANGAANAASKQNTGPDGTENTAQIQQP